jgi:hypothetical protein
MFQVKIRDETLSPQFKERNKARVAAVGLYTAGGVVAMKREGMR